MPKVKSNISQSNMELEVSLEEMFGQEVTDQSLREEIGQAIIDKIVERTQSGKRLGGGSLKGYSKAYKESLAFKVTGKNESGPANLTLTGDMLGTLDIKDDTETKLKIGWQSDTENAKAFNHHTGDTLPKRPFFGLQQNELQEIESEFARKVSIKNNLNKAKGETEFRQTSVNEIFKVLSELEDENG